MIKNISRTILLLVLMAVVGCVAYPVVLWIIGQTVFPFQANGSIVKAPDGTPVGSTLIAQPFTQDKYFWPRPSAASYNGAASSSAALAVSNYALRSRVAAALGPIVRYKTGPKAGSLVAPDIEQWFQSDTFQGAPSIVAQWADAHNSLAQAWVNTDSLHIGFVNAWATAHKAIVDEFVKSNPSIPRPGAPDLAVVFFKSFSKDNPGKFLSVNSHATPDGKTNPAIEAVKDGSDIQSTFFDMWRQDHAKADLANVPGDMVTTSGSGLDPHITVDNAMFQLDRVASAWALQTKRNPATMREEILHIISTSKIAPLGGLAGDEIVNVLKLNLELSKKYGS
jgi:K+-transporting ATPase ATPase C chain